MAPPSQRSATKLPSERGTEHSSRELNMGAPPLSPSRTTITSLRPHDVLSGRGSGTNEWIGNQNFRALITSRRTDYRTAANLERKNEVATHVYETIKSRGGRFLTRVNKAKGFVIEDGEWMELEEGEAVEKCKQGLRQEPRPSKSQKKREAEQCSQGAFGASSEMFHSQTPLVSSGRSMHLLPPSLMASGLPPVDPRVLLLRRLATLREQQATVSATGYHSNQPIVTSLNPSMNTILPQLRPYDDAMLSMPAAPRYPNPTIQSTRLLARQQPLVTSSLQHLSPLSQHQDIAVADDITSYNRVSEAPPIVTSTVDEHSVAIDSWQAHQDSTEWASNDEVSDFLLASLGWDANHPKFTEEQFELERESLSEEEKISALADLFGKCCSARQSKRTRKDLDETSTEFLIKQMKQEIEAIPVDRKPALIEAQKKARPEEFSNERLEQFLLCEGRNPKLAAERFVSYWKCRREVFGDKYTQRMSLSEAAAGEEIAAIETGCYRLLPRKDSSGRPLVLLDMSCNTGDGYTQESFLRSIWYTNEVIARECLGSGKSDFVFIGYYKKVTVWDFSRKVYGAMATYETTALPVKFAAAHCLVPESSGVVGMLKPLFGALLDSRRRSRIVLHDVADEDVAGALSSYGIEKNMLPTKLGGSLDLNPREWISQQRAAEMEEL